jgi:signal transduction histidine kinase/DNA-binding response OmpR family regulator
MNKQSTNDPKEVLDVNLLPSEIANLSAEQKELLLIKALAELKTKNRELEIEAALERVRAQALAMQTSDDLIEVANVLREQMGKLGQPELESSIVHLYEGDFETFNVWYAYAAPSVSKGIITGFGTVSKNATEWTREVIAKYQSAETEYTIVSSGQKLEEWYKVLETFAADTIEYGDQGEIIVPEILYYHFSKFSGGALLMISNQQPSQESREMQKRAAAVFNLAYRRFMDLKLSQERERQAIEHERWETEQLRKVDEIKTHFFSNITHEFRTPLSLILPSVEQMLQEVDEPRHRHRLMLIKRNARQLLGLINQLLDISKLESGNMPLAEFRGDVEVFVNQLLDAFHSAAEEKRIRLFYTFQGVNEEWLFDADKWSKIINNLLSNALKFTPAGGEIRMELNIYNSHDSEPDHALKKNFKALITIQDSGIGIPAEKLPHIFDRFYQVDNTHTRAFGGTGIGLSLVKELIELLNGQIRVNSEPEAGTIFTLELPIRKAESCPDVPKAETVVAVTSFEEPDELGVNSSKKHYPPMQSMEAPLLLLIDDNADLREFIAGELSSTYRVLTAVNGEEGWQLAQQELPEVIISDVMMPVLDGYAFTERLKTNPLTNHIAIMLLTAKAAQESKVAGLMYGADDYLTKPFHLQELTLRLRNLLDHQQKLRQHYQQQLTTPPQGLCIEKVENKFLQMLYQAIEAQLDNSGFDVDSLAEAATLSRRTLYRKLATLTGLTPNEIIRNYRLLRAAQLLQTGHSVSQVAYQVGFESPSYFGQCFKEKYQITPSEYLQQHVSQS